MSYKSAVLYDYPIAYYPLDDLTTVDLVEDFTDFLSQFSTYQDVLDNVSSYANIYGDVAYDHSGCENDGNYIGDPETNLIPLVAGNSRATKITNINSVSYNITNNYTAASTTSQFATATSSDNDFTIEFWFYPSISSSNQVPLVADSSENIGVFYEKGNILFKVDSESVQYTMPYLNKSFHVACVYNQTSISIYLDGQLVAYKPLSNFEFTNSSVGFRSGPAPSGNYFLINSVAFYRYSLSQSSMLYHIEEAKAMPAINIVQPDGGESFTIYDNDLTAVHRFVYPTDKSWLEIIEDGVSYIESGNYLQTDYSSAATSSTVILNDFITIPPTLTIDSSKIEWYGDNGISVSISSDGSTYTQCVNGQQIPGYSLTSFGSLSGLYIRVTFTSTNNSKFLPRLYRLILSFYNNQTLYSDNGNSYISTLENESSISNYNITFGSEVKEILSRDKRNGLKAVADAGFNINIDSGIQTVEFFYTPEAITDSGLVSTYATNGYAASTIYWHNSGTMSKTNISAIYVNGVNKTSETNVSNIFKAGELHHVIVVFGSEVGDEIRFNYSAYGSVPALYQNIGIYPSQFTNTQASDHYDYYIRRISESITDATTTTLTEDGAEAYNNEWVVIQSI